MTYYGDCALGATLDLHFATRQFSTGAPFLLAGSPAVAAYPDNSTTQLSAGITLDTNFDGLPGLNHVRIVATTGNGYAAGVNYTLVLTAGTVDSVSVAGEVLGAFSLEARSGLTAAQVNAEIVDALSTDVQAELAAVPVANASLAAKINWLFVLARNKILQTATTQTVRNDADSATIATATVADSAGTLTRGEYT